MDAYGRISSEEALDKNGRVVGKGLEYMRSQPLSSIQVDVVPKEKVTLVTEVDANSGFLTFRQDVEDQVIKTSRNYCRKFQGYTLEKVNNDENGDLLSFEDDFYPILHKMLNTKQEWSALLRFRGRATFEIGVMEWTELILANFGETLNQAGIHGAVGVSRYPYHYCVNTWKAFLELWGPLTNTLHHGNGEMSISLYDLKLIGGLPISGVPYEEFIPENKELHRDGPYPATLSELLCIHSQLCVSNKQKFVRWEEWVRHFYRGKLLYAAYSENTQQISHAQPEKFMSSRPTFKVSKEGELAAFLAYWLSRFVLPSDGFKIRPETFYMACLMARGVRVSLAPSVLGHIYHGLREIVTNPRGPGESRSCFPVHYVIGWLGEHFSSLYRRRADSGFPENYPHLARYAGIKAKDLDITSARLVFRIEDTVEYRPSPFIEQKGHFLIDDGNLSEEKFELLVCLRSALLPVRIGDNLWLEPYYPNRFARQFGFDQGVPSNKLQFNIEKRRKCCIEDLAKAQKILLRGGTGTRFYIPRSSYNGICTWTYCRWWMRACAPYLGRSVSFVYRTLKKHPLERQDNIFVIKSLREVSTAMQGEVLFPDFGRADPVAHFGDTSPTKRRSEGTNKEAHREPSYDTDESSSTKRARCERHDDFRDGVAGNTTLFPYDHASDQGIASYDGDNTVVARLKSVVTRDLTLGPQSPKLNLRNSESRLKETRTGSKKVNPESKNLEPKSRKLEPKKKKPVPKEHSVELSLKKVEPKTTKPSSKKFDVELSLSGLESRTKDSELELRQAEPLSKPAQERYDIELPLNEVELEIKDLELELQQSEPELKNSEPPSKPAQEKCGAELPVNELESETRDSEQKQTEPFFYFFGKQEQTEPRLKGPELQGEELIALSEDNSETISGTTGLTGSGTSENIYEDVSPLTGTSSILQEKCGAELPVNELESETRDSEQEQTEPFFYFFGKQEQTEPKLKGPGLQAEDKLVEFDRVKSSYKTRPEEFEKLISCLKSFGQQSE